MADWWRRFASSFCERFGRFETRVSQNEQHLTEVDQRLSRVEQANQRQALRLRLLEEQADPRGLLGDD